MAHRPAILACTAVNKEHASNKVDGEDPHPKLSPDLHMHVVSHVHPHSHIQRHTRHTHVYIYTYTDTNTERGGEGGERE